MASVGYTCLLLLALVAGCTARPLYPLPSGPPAAEKQPLQTFRAYNFAHRGSNGELPEETAPAYMRAIEEGADFIESDILATKDGHLICTHDVTLDTTTDVADRPEFAGRKRTYEVQWENVTGWFPIDFTLEEIKTLRTKQRFPFRDQQYNGKFEIITFDEYISIALNAPRVVGIYPEIKNPVWVNKYIKWENGMKFEDKFVETLKKWGYKGEYMSKDWLAKPIFIQSFAPSSLVYISDLIDSPKIFLIDDLNILTEDTKQSYDEITSDAYFDYIKNYCVGIGPYKDTVVPSKNNYLTTATDLIAKAHSRNMQVHPYTFRNENSFLSLDYHQDPYEEYDFWLNTMKVDGLFTDFTGSLHRYQEWSTPRPQWKAKKLLEKVQSLVATFKFKKH